MIDQGINSGMLITQVLNLLFITTVFALPVLALFMLFRARPGSDLVLVLWVLAILAFPVIGPIAFMMYRFIRPGGSAPQANKEPHAG